jgi:tetratricopeptide (TPR) repeat protein
MNFAWFWFNEGNYEQAANMANMALSINPENADVYNILGLIELRSHSIEKAVEYLERANSFENGKDTPIFHNLGFAYFKNGEYKESLEVFNNSLRQKQTCLAKLGAAMSLYKLGDKSKEREWIDGCSDRADFA